MVTCTPYIVVTNVTAFGGLDLLNAPAPDGVLFTLSAASLLVGKTENAISIVLCRRPQDFDPPHYRRGQGTHDHRIVTAHDLAVLRTLWPVVVKQKRSFHVVSPRA